MLKTQAEELLAFLLLTHPDKVDLKALDSRAFSHPCCRALWKEAQDMELSDSTISSTALLDRLSERDHEYATEILVGDHGVMDPGDVGHLVEQVKDSYLHRDVVNKIFMVGSRARKEVIRSGKEVVAELAAVLHEAESFIPSAATEEGPKALEFANYISELQQRKNQGEDVGFGYMTGLRELDRFIGGVPRYGNIVFKGRTNHGKSALLNQCLLNWAKQGIPTLSFSLEDREGTRMRHLSNLSGVPLSDILKLRLNSRQEDMIHEAAEKLARLPLYTRYTGGINSSDIILEAKKLQATKGIKVVAVDYLQVLGGAAGQSEYERLSQASKAFQDAAKELELMFALGSQVTDSAEQYNKSKQYVPRDTNTKGCKAIADHAEAIFEIYQPNKGDRDKEQLIELHVLKMKNANSGVVHLDNGLDCMRLG